MTDNNIAKYTVIKREFNGIPQVIKPEEISNFINGTELNKEWYQTIALYTDEQAKTIRQSKSIKGIYDVKTNKIVLDFDSKDKIEIAQDDAKTVCSRIKETLKVKEKDIEIYFSGNKGFHVVLTLNKLITPRQAEIIAHKLASDLKSFDTSLYDATQIIRVPWTKNVKSGLYKIPITIEQLEGNLNTMKELAKDLNNVDDQLFNPEPTDIPELLLAEPVVSKKEVLQNE